MFSDRIFVRAPVVLILSSGCNSIGACFSIGLSLERCFFSWGRLY